TLDARIAAPAGSGSDAAALREIGDVIRQVAKQLPRAEAAGLDATAPPGAATPTANGQQPAQVLETRRKELLAALDAITERGNKGLSDRAAELRRQVEALQSSSGDPDLAVLGERLRNLDEVFGAVRATADPLAAESASQLAALRDLAQSQV